MTLGEYRVGLEFNPGGDARVTYVKRTIADLIDYVSHSQRDRQAWNAEQARVISIACDRLEEAAMWAVKSVTKPAPPSGD